MMGEAKPTWTRNKHDYLQLVNQAGPAGCRARGVAFGSACASLRALGWVERITPAVGIKVRITPLGVRALQAWDAGQRGDLDLRTDDDRKRQALQEVLEAVEQHDLHEQLLQELFQRVPLMTFQRLLRKGLEAAGAAAVASVTIEDAQELHEALAADGPTHGVVMADFRPERLHQGGTYTIECRPAAAQILERGEEVLRKGDPLEQFHQGGLIGKVPEGMIPRIIETGQVVPATDPRLTAAAPGGTKTVTIVVDQLPPADAHRDRALKEAGLVNLLGGARSFVPGGYTGDRPAGPAFQETPPAVLQDAPADEQEDDDDRRVLCPKCEGRGSTGPAHLDCTRCNTRGYVFRTVKM